MMETQIRNFKFIRILFYILLSTTLLTNCKKDKLETINRPVETNNTPPTDAKTHKPISEFFTKYQPSVQNFTVNIDQPSPIIGSMGTVIFFYPEALINSSNQVVTGQVDITLTELYSKADLLFAKRPTESLGEAIISAGAINIQASQNGEELSLWNRRLSIMIPANGPVIRNMATFYGNSNVFTNAEGNVDSTFTWEPDPDTFFLFADTAWFLDSLNITNSDFPYRIFPKNLNWINCDYFYDQNVPKTNIEVKVPNEFETYNTNVFIVFKNERGVIQLYNTTSGDPFHSFNSAEIPIGIEIQLIVFAGKDDEYYYSYSDHTVGNNDVYTVALDSTTEEDFKALIDAL